MKNHHNQQLSISDLTRSYDELFQEEGRLRDTDAFYQWVLDRLITHSDGRLLDIACGEGILLKFAEELGLQSYGVDISIQGVILALERTGANAIAVANGEQLPFPDNCFDFVTNIGSLEHFLNPESGLDEMVRVLRMNGLAALVLPNSYYLIDIFWQVLRTGYGPSHRQPLERFATYREWLEIIELSGLNVIKAYKYNLVLPRSKEDFRWYQNHPRKILNLIFSPFIPFNLSNHFLYICCKDKG